MCTMTYKSNDGFRTICPIFLYLNNIPIIFVPLLIKLCDEFYAINQGYVIRTEV